jgi:hypothetical protein
MTEDEDKPAPPPHPMEHRWNPFGIYCVGCPERSRGNIMPKPCAECFLAYSRSPKGPARVKPEV